MFNREQNPDHQLDALRAAGCHKILCDKASGKLASRPEWDRLLEQARAGDQLVITRLDRAGRSVAHLVELAADLDRRGVALVVLSQGIDTTTPAGRLTFHILAALGESRPTSSGKTPETASRQPQPAAAAAGGPP